ncbi:chromosome partitioning protein ParB [Bryobacterales bacterium F-183]|nr:chromosome partitioning protein ParB [Bryobacterales bacterium F-183]
MSNDKRKVLGKGISALLPSRSAGNTTPSAAAATAPAPAVAPAVEAPLNAVLDLPVDQIEPSPHQPRHVFEQTKLEELAQSIRENGIIQPLVIRRKPNSDRYELVAGERRLRASKIAGLAKVPVIIQDFAPDRLMEIALIENIQREDLNPIELAIAYDRLNRELGLSHDQIGQRCGKDRSSVANTIRLLKLPEPVRDMVRDGALSMGQARALLPLENAAEMVKMAEKAVAQGWTTRQMETQVRLTLEPAKPKAEKVESRQDPNIRSAAQELEQHLGTRVRIVEQNENRGKIEIEYFSQEELMRLHEQLLGK